MSERGTVTIYSYTHNGPRDRRGRIKGKREPLVHLVGWEELRDISSIAFPPAAALKIAAAIRRAAFAAKRNRKIEAVEIKFGQQP